MATTLRGRAIGLALIACLLVPAASACSDHDKTDGKSGNTGNVPTNTGGPVKATVHWDLRDGHSTKQVKWRGQSSFEVGGGVQVKLELPGRTFQDRVDRFGAGKQSDQISDISMYYPGASVSAAYTRARKLAQEWNLDARQLDAWYANQKSHPSRPADLPQVLANSSGLKPTGPGGPIPSVEILYSFDQANPAMVKIEFFWRPS